jgi:hypothetical protein
MADYLPSSQEGFLAWSDNFLTVLRANREILAISEERVDALANQYRQCKESVVAYAEAKERIRLLYEKKRATIQEVQRYTHDLTQRLLNDPEISDSTKIYLGILPTKKYYPRTPYAVQSLHVTPKMVGKTIADGVNLVHWKRPRNAPDTVYIVMAVPYEGGTWTEVARTKGCRFQHKNQTVGRPMCYRIVSQRGDLQSVSMPVIAYGGYVHERAQAG